MGLDERRAKCRDLIRRYYSAVPRREDLLDRAVVRDLPADARLLDAGCGEDLPMLERYANRVGVAVGVDRATPVVDPRGRFIRGDLSALPFATGSFDLIISRSVFEHLEDPVAVFAEMRRVLRPNGKLVFTTPNKYYYSCLVARTIPFRWKDLYMRWMFGEEGYDHFPVYYRANTRNAFRQIAKAAKLRLERTDAVRAYPYYLMFSPLLFRLGMYYDWTITALGLDSLQSTWLVVMSKQE